MEEFPRYTRVENRKCKLTDKEIYEIQIRHDNGDTYKEISKDYKVSAQAIHYWCMNEEDRKEMSKKRNKIYSDKKKDRKPFDYKAYRKRKKRLHPELKDYEKCFTVAIRKETQPGYLESVKKTNKKMYEKYKDKLKKKHKEYQKTHLEKFREYNHRAYLKRKNKINNITPTTSAYERFNKNIN